MRTCGQLRTRRPRFVCRSCAYLVALPCLKAGATQLLVVNLLKPSYGRNMRRLRLLPVFAIGAIAFLSLSPPATPATDSVSLRVLRSPMNSGTANFLFAVVRPAGVTCTARVGKAGGTTKSLGARVTSQGSAEWRFVVPRSTKTARWIARVACGRAGVKTIAFTARGQTPPRPQPPAQIPARIVVEKSGVASRLSSIGSYFSGYGVVLQNASPDQDALDVQVVVNLVDAAGAIVVSDSNTYKGIPAGATYFAAGETISSGRPVRLEVSVRIGSVQSKRIGSLPPVSNARVEDSFSSARYRGEFSNPYTQPMSSSARITIVCFGASGNVIGGGRTYPFASVLPGGRIGFEGSLEGLTAAQVSSVQVSVEPEVGS